MEEERLAVSGAVGSSTGGDFLTGELIWVLDPAVIDVLSTHPGAFGYVAGILYMNYVDSAGIERDLAVLSAGSRIEARRADDTGESLSGRVTDITTDTDGVMLVVDWQGNSEPEPIPYSSYSFTLIRAQTEPQP